MFIFQLTAAIPQEKGATAFYLLLEKWAASRGIPVEIVPASASKSRSLPPASMWSGFAIPKTLLSKRKIEVSAKEPIILLHESAHQFLMVGKGFVVEHYFDIARLEKSTDSLKKVNSDTAFMRKRPLHAALNQLQISISGSFRENFEQNKAGFQQHDRLNTMLYRMFSAESALPPALQKKLEAVLGKPQFYPYRFGPKSDVADVLLNKRGAGYSRIGNILDESSVFKLGIDSPGHPMTDYHEFFSSMATALSFDGKHFFAKLGALAELSRKEPALLGIFADFKSLLSESISLARDFRAEILALPGSKAPPELENLSKNLDALENWLKKN